jgi:hypothetical protein
MRVTVDLTWDLNTEADLAGYKVYWSEGSSKPKALAFSGGTLEVQLSVLLKAKTVYTFSVAAYDIAGNESEARVLKAVWCE